MRNFSKNFNFAVDYLRYQLHKQCGSLFSTVPQESISKPLQHFRTTENNPAYHTRDHIGKFYLVPEDVKSKLFFSGGIPKSLDILMKTFREHCFMVREPALEAIDIIRNMNFSHPALRLVFYGKNGTGKTLSIAHVLHFAYENKFLLVHLPWVSNWTKRPKEVLVSQYNEKRIDLPVESAIWLQHFKLQNSKLMDELKLKTSKSYTWSKREVTEEGQPVMDIVEHGIQRVRHSSDCVAALLREIKLQSQTGKFKTLVAVDGVNAFWCKTNVRKADKSVANAEEVTIVRAFLKLLQNDWNNGVVVTTVDIVPHDRNATKNPVYPYTPRALLGKEGFELLTPFVPIRTDNYTEKEVLSVLDYYCDRMWIQSERARSEEGRLQIKFLSGNNPFELMKICDAL